MQKPTQEGNFLDKNLNMIITLYLLIKKTTRLFFLECRLAKESINLIMIYAALFVVLLVSLWITTLLIIILILHYFIGGWLLPLAIINGFNLMLITLVAWRIAHCKKNISFNYTRSHLSRGFHHEHSDLRSTNTNA